MRRGSIAVLVGLAIGTASGCTTPSSVPQYAAPSAPPLTVTVTTDPPPRADGTVPRNARFVILLDGYPDPDSVGFGPITLHSGRGSFDLGIDVDLVGRAVVVTPRSLLGPSTQYNLVVSGLASLDDRRQVGTADGRVQVGVDTGDPHPAPPQPTWCSQHGEAAVQPLLATCAPFCHSRVGRSGRTRTPTRALDLTGDPRDPSFGLVGVTSVGLRGTPYPLARVAAGDPARSVLLRKLLGGNPQANSHDPAYPNLRVDGQRMPIDIDSERALPPLDDGTLALVQQWIAAGAPLGPIRTDGSCPAVP